MRTIQQGCFSELRTGSCNERADMVTKLYSRCSHGSPNLMKHHKNRVYFNKRVNNFFLATDHAKLSWSSLTECRKYFIPVLCNQHGTEYNLDDSTPLTNGYPSVSSQKDKRKLVGVLTDGLHHTSARNELTKLALPAIVGQALDPVAQLLETAFIGRLGPVELAAAGVSVSIFNIISKLFNVPLLSVTTSFVAEELSKDADKASQKGYLANKKPSQNIVEKLVLPSVSTALLLASIIGAVEALALFMGAGAFLNMMGISRISPMRSPAQQFLSLRALGAPAVVVSLAIQGVFRGFKDTKTPLVCVGFGNLSSIIFLPLLAYSFGLGITGAAIATVASQYITTFLLIWFLSKRAVILPPRIQELQFGGYVKSGGLLLGRTLSVLITMTLGTSMAARLGPLAMAAHQICLQIWLAVSLLSDALALSAQALIASSYAKFDYKRVKEITHCVLKTGLLTGITLAIILFMSFGNIAELFTKDVELLNIVRTGVVFVSASQPINALAFIFDGLHYGVSDFAYSAYSMMAVAVISSAVLLYAPPRFAINGVWCGLTLFMTLRMAAGIIRLCWRSGPWWFLQHDEVKYEPSYNTHSVLPVEEEPQELDYAITND
ncbi:hypothetical protein KFK09_010058 [Dendrobium nobile]|uniref:Protein DETOXIFICATION n=1 Tax=Dendrobium nobile TaxID=94219 RepID=A0A8T3BLU8_DENNO|nr:hypothetical protein KFK09_010058 [Dendrobium nobile]